jgi:HK97 gp10 family phage protein
MADRNQKLWDQFDKLKAVSVLQAMLAGGNVILREAKRLAPVDTGFMRDSGYVREASPDEAPPPAVSVVFVAPYSSFQEFGTSRMAAQPFLRPAIDTKRDAAIKAIGSAVVKEIRTVVSGGG